MPRATRKKLPVNTPVPPAVPPPPFPRIAPKFHLQCETFLQDQILLLPGLLSEHECARLVQFVEQLPLQLTPPKKRGEAERVNYRISIPSPAFAQDLYTVIAPHLPHFPTPAFVGGDARPTVALNSNIRLYKYTEGQYFGQHYDEAVSDHMTPGLVSEWTLLIYLTGIEDGVQGGETIFYKGKGKKSEAIVPPLRRGLALLHRHGYDCLLHEGSPVLKGTKYVLRSDLMFPIPGL